MIERCQPVQLPDGTTVQLIGGPLTDEDREHLAAIVAALPPITDEQAERQRVMRKRNHDRLVRLGMVGE